MNGNPVREFRDGNGNMMALLIRGWAGHAAMDGSHGVKFFTPPQADMQVGWMRHPVGKVVQPHVHRPAARQIYRTTEVLLLRAGRLKIDLFGDDGWEVQSFVMEAGDVAVLTSGGHGVEVLESCEVWEVKQGPYDVTEKVAVVASGKGVTT